MLKPELLRIFVTICETGSFTTTAQLLGLPKASASDAIRRLEEHMNTRLLQRTTRKVQVTTDGKQFYERAKDLLSDFEETENMFIVDDRAISGKVRIDMPVPFATKVIIPVLGKFLEKYPKLEIDLSCTDRRVDLVREGFDFVVRVGGQGDSSLMAKKIGEQHFVNCVSPSYIEKYGMPKNLKDLENHYQVHYVQSLGSKPDGFEYFDGTKYVLHQTKALITVNSIEAYYSACLAGLGIIQAPLVGIEQELKAGRLKRVLPKYVAEPFPVSFIFPHRRHVPRRVRLCMEWIEAEVKRYLKN